LIQDSDEGDSLLLLTDHPDPRLIHFVYKVSQAGVPSLERSNVINLSERGGVRPSEFINDVIVSSDGRTAVASVYAGKLKVITLDQKGKTTAFDVS
jgi:DNA damage-binding protein 1